MIRDIFKRVSIASITALLFSSPIAAETFIFTAIPDEDETKLVERFQGMADYLSEELDVEVRYIPVKSYAAAISAFRNNQVQLAWFGGLSGVQARDLVPGSEAIAQGTEDASNFVSHFIAHKSADLEPMDDLSEELRGKTFTFGSKGSTSGRLMPEYHIREAFGESPDEVFSRVGYSGNHTRTLRLVEAGTYQTGVVNFKVWEKELEDGNIDTDQVGIIWTTPPYPNYQWTIRAGVDEKFGDGFKERVTEALLKLDDKELLNNFPRTAFIPASNDLYEPIEKVGKEIGILD